MTGGKLLDMNPEGRRDDWGEPDPPEEPDPEEYEDQWDMSTQYTHEDRDYREPWPDE